MSPEGIVARYHIAFDRWAISKHNSLREGVLPQALTKSRGGKWTSYSARVDRSVVFFGIDRVVPHSEKSVSKSYRSSFTEALKNGCEEKVRDSVSRILGSKYEDFHFKSHSKYRLPFVKKGKFSYSGFNMGAGENALFEIFFNLHACPEGTLVIIDEIELGLHQSAQKRLISELKNICLSRKIQVICTTHSPAILARVPPSSRYYIDSYENETVAIRGIASQYAAGKLAEEHSKELTIYVEDGIAADILFATFNKEMRSRISVIPIGSDSAVISHLAGLRKANSQEKIMAVLDGDKSKEIASRKNLFLRKLESYDDKSVEEKWIGDRLITLPGLTWPEKWAMSSLKAKLTDEFVDYVGSTRDELTDYIDQAEVAGKHKEFVSLAKSLHMDERDLRRVVSRHLALNYREDFLKIKDMANVFLAS